MNGDWRQHVETNVQQKHIKICKANLELVQRSPFLRQVHSSLLLGANIFIAR